jgi:hypothetical protein
MWLFPVTRIACSLADAIFKDNVDPARYTSGLKMGWHDKTRAGNPIIGWTHIYIPYCTGDIHWGNNVKTYGAGASEITIRHKGGVNVKAALDWMYAELAAPKKILVTGCSAGGYGSIGWAPELQRRYADARVYHFSDSAAGVITADFFEKSFPAWNAVSTFPIFLGSATPPTSLAGLYAMVAARYPNNIYSQYNTRLDENQALFFSAMGGGDANEWSTQMKASMKTLLASSTNFRAFLAEGTQHCILPFDEFYTVEAGGKKLTDWLSDMVSEKPLETAACAECAP